MRKSVQKIQNLKNEGKKITVLTAYDYSTAKYVDECDIDIILVGDSLAQVVLGYENTTDVSMKEMQIFVSAVSRGVEKAMVVADMPFMSFQISKEEATKNACKFIKAGANAVKLEGSSPYLLDIIKHLTSIGIPVMGHLGFTPMSINTIGGHKIQGKDSQKTIDILNEAKKLQEAGCFSVVLEMVPKQSSKFIASKLDIPVIGIGAGVEVDGQVLVVDDILGKYDRLKPRFARQYCNLKDIMKDAINAYLNDVRNSNFPNDEESFILEQKEEEALESYR